MFKILQNLYMIKRLMGAVLVDWFSSWLAEQGVRGSNPGLTTSIGWFPASKSGYDWKIVKAT